MKTAFVYVPEDGLYADDVLEHFEHTRLPDCAQAVLYTPESMDGATLQDALRDFREEIETATNANDEPVMVAVYTADIDLLRAVVFDLLQHRLPVVFVLDDNQRQMIGDHK